MLLLTWEDRRQERNGPRGYTRDLQALNSPSDACPVKNPHKALDVALA